MRATTAIISGLVLILGVVSPVHAAISIAVTGAWSRTITASDLQGGAGGDLVSTYESATNQASITISGTTDNTDAWRVDVKRTDGTWHANFTLSVKRTGDGSGGGGITGGSAYQSIEITDASFFSGTGDRSGVTAQFKLEGMSVQVPPATYSTTITYTVVDT